MRSKVQQLINKSNKVLPSLTDNQLIQIQNRNSKGGKTSGPLNYKNSVGLFGRSEEKIKQDASSGGSKSAELYKGKFLKDWVEENPELAFEQNSKIGKKQGRINVETGHLKKVRINGGKTASEIEYTCEHCHKKVNGAVYFRWHGDNCKHYEKILEQLSVIKMLNKKQFNSNDIVSLCKKIEYNYKLIKYGILKNKDYITIVKIGTNQSNPTIFKLK